MWGIDSLHWFIFPIMICLKSLGDSWSYELICRTIFTIDDICGDSDNILERKIAYRIGYLMSSIWFNFLMSHDTLIVLDTVSHNISWYNTIDRIYEVIWCCSIKYFSCQSILRSSRQIAGLFTNLFQCFILKFHAFFF